MRFKKLLFACKGLEWALLDPPSEVTAIPDKVFEKLRTVSGDQAHTYVTAMAESFKKKEDLLGQNYTKIQKYTKITAVCAEESHATILHVQCMLPYQIKK